MKKFIYIILFLISIEHSFPQQIIQMRKEGGVYTMPCEVNGLSLRFIFDTGASEVSISLAEAVFMLKNGYLSESDIKGSASYSIANGDIVEGTIINLRQLKIGNTYLYNVDASIVHTNTAPLLLGQSALSKVGKFSFDYSNNTLVFGEGIYPTSKGLSFSEIQFLLESNKINEAITAIQEEILIYPKTQYASSLLLIKAQLLTKVFETDPYSSRRILEIGISAFRAYNQAYELGTSKLKSSVGTEIAYEPMVPTAPDDLKRYSIATLKNAAFDKAIERYNSDDYEMAYEFFDLAGEVDLRDTTVHYNAGFLANELGKTEDAIRHFNYLLEVEEYNKLNAYYSLVQIQSAEKNPEAAYEVVQKGRADYPDDKALAEYEIQLLLQLDKMDEAMASIKEALVNDPNNVGILLRSGYLKEQSGDIQGALADYKKTVEIDPTYYEGNYYTGALMVDQSREILAELNSLSDAEWEKRSESMGIEANQYYEDAVPYFERALAQKPEDTNTMIVLFQIYTRLKNNNKAKKYNSKLEKLLGPNWMEN